MASGASSTLGLGMSLILKMKYNFAMRGFISTGSSCYKKCFCLKCGYREKNRQGDDTKMLVKPEMSLLLILFMLLASCGRSNEYEVGVFNNTRHVPVKIKIQFRLFAGPPSVSAAARTRPVARDCAGTSRGWLRWQGSRGCR